MPKIQIPTSYDPRKIKSQEAFHRSRAKVRGYGGAMGGGKSRAICEEFFQAALDYPGILAPIFRQRHVSITDTTRRTFFEQVLPGELRPYCKVIQSGGRDYIKLPNASEIHFLGLDDPVKAFSAEYGMVGFDEAHEMSEEDVVLINTRLRQRCPDCIRVGEKDCPHYPHTMVLGFNPENPGHWLHQWMIDGSEKTPYGNQKDELWASEAIKPIGDCEFFFANALHNPFLPAGYVETTLGGMPDLLRRRYLNGEWIFTSGECYFDVDALSELVQGEPLYRMDFRAERNGASANLHRHSRGRWRIYEEPEEGLRYAMGADVSTAKGQDFSAAYITRLDEPRLVAEFRAKLDVDLFAEQLHFGGRWYQSAEIAVESAGGWGEPVIISLRDGRAGRPPYPRLYRHVLSSRSELPTVKTFGYPMNTKTRPLVLSQLEKMIRERALPFLPQSLYEECPTFVYQDTLPSPRAQDGCFDDCVMAAAITMELYRLRGHHPPREERRDRVRSERKRIKKILKRDPFYSPRRRQAA